eukprot:TRINITY_DN12883_c0_g1_i1.p2 TRINITY_DN12883_c0_g1~~TRINITY_DN12883_c0_g1_i1.p2  ORF type:complete len:58 (+),score=4.45 TRINITY_DN12883_c0_g1_i1:223-396(+)
MRLKQRRVPFSPIPEILEMPERRMSQFQSLDTFFQGPSQVVSSTLPPRQNVSPVQHR